MLIIRIGRCSRTLTRPSWVGWKIDRWTIDLRLIAHVWNLMPAAETIPGLLSSIGLLVQGVIGLRS
jgi:hypothetical protein